MKEKANLMKLGLKCSADARTVKYKDDQPRDKKGKPIPYDGKLTCGEWVLQVEWGFQTDTWIVGFQADTWIVGFQADTWIVGFQADTWIVGFQADTWTVGFQTDTWTVGFQADTWTAGFQTDPWTVVFRLTHG